MEPAESTAVAHPHSDASVPVPSPSGGTDAGRVAAAWMKLLRRLLDVVFPRGALILSVLTFGYFAMGILRNRALANTF